MDSTLLTDKISEAKQIEILTAEKRNLQRTLDVKKEELRKLNLVKMYRTKDDLVQMEGLVTKWRVAAQDSLLELYKSCDREPKPSLRNFIAMLHIDPDLLGYDVINDCFKS